MGSLNLKTRYCRWFNCSELIITSRRKLTIEKRTKIVCEPKKSKNFSAVGKFYKVSPESGWKIIKKGLVFNFTGSYDIILK